MPKKEVVKENYAILRSMFGDYWVGKISLETNGKSIFPTFDEAIEEAIEITDSVENTDELQGCLEEECETVREEMKKWIIE